MVECHVLLIDSDLDTLNAFQTLLERRGFIITISQSVDEAIQLMQAVEFDLIITDLFFPESNSGYHFLKIIRDFTNVPVIALTGDGMLEDKQLTFDAGFTYHLLKPIRITDLEVAIAKALDGNSMEAPSHQNNN